MHELVILDDSMIKSMARDPNFLSEFPVLKQAVATQAAGTAAMTKRRCNDCSQTPQAAGANFNNIKYALTQLGGDKKKRLLQLLNARQVRIQVSIDSKVVRYTLTSQS